METHNLILLWMSLLLVLEALAAPTPKPELIGAHELIPREQWGAHAPLATKPLAHPTEFVIVSHTASNSCFSVQACSRLLKVFQDYHVSYIGSTDIGYNFLIGGDGRIYAGRGWDAKNFHGIPGSIGVSFIGNYVYDDLGVKMESAFKDLLSEGVRLGKLEKDYRIVAHNQTHDTVSPGRNVFEFLKGLSHFDAKYEKA